MLVTPLAENGELLVLGSEAGLQINVGSHGSEAQVLLDGELSNDASSFRDVTETDPCDVLGLHANQRALTQSDRPRLRADES